MGISEYNEAVALISENEDLFDPLGPRDEILISDAEVALGLIFPPTYREFLKKYGVASFRGYEFYGITSGNFTNATVPNGIWLTLEERKTSGLPETLVVIYDTGDGDYFVLDTKQHNIDGECPVKVWHPGGSRPDDNLEVISEDFGTFFLECIREALRHEGR